MLPLSNTFWGTEKCCIRLVPPHLGTWTKNRWPSIGTSLPLVDLINQGMMIVEQKRLAACCLIDCRWHHCLFYCSAPPLFSFTYGNASGSLQFATVPRYHHKLLKRAERSEFFETPSFAITRNTRAKSPSSYLIGVIFIKVVHTNQRCVAENVYWYIYSILLWNINYFNLS